MSQNLTKSECEQAVKAWKNIKPDYSRIENIVNPTAVFYFDGKACDWVNEHNNNKYFSAYTGVHDEQLVLIVVPLDKDGKEEELSSYLALPLKPLEHDLTFLEREETVSVKKTILSKNLDITLAVEEVELPTNNEPALPENISLGEVELWKNSCFDWFYHECTDYKGQRIFNRFTVPFTDLIEGIENHEEVICLFAFKNSNIYNRLIPVLVFVAVDGATRQARVIRLTRRIQGIETISNAYDWARPCPPFCREEQETDLFS